MSNIDKQALRQKAVKAGGEEWQSRKMPGPAGEYTVIVKGSLEKHPGWTTCRPVADEVIDKKTMDFIAAANPATMLALLDELEKEKGYASTYEAEKWHYHGLAESEGERADRAEKQVDELTMWVKRLAHSLRNAKPNRKLHIDAMDYLSSKGLISVEDVLR
ncbi:ead/Ea22-like family protein [Salmonella enterica]|uniref:Ead/Ea22-like family protein n=1 Tax=Salmonella houtenae TaxID=59205 RepID=A0A5Y2SI14_SALHO|nr:ead/Ea22-like family protein [Salmonella enterica]EBP3920925.1 ead/Ea22-like family protein [Salmonella enterica subsp. enterica]ECA5352507.1 ead/Ea22-like family protein [Salmonella enterica subsp. enterica serovar Mississippi]ECF6076138.1 ead/Ea22-like family protein [Salmonella enterica subsp. houtenae]EDL3548092.1 ead/Ea22-like family protein [Salmonella enterica subsp. enterica serovar Newport]EDQ0399420.1 ead/Ea22-like family protein [Salmonella enterica subsp. enterica serovar Saintp